MLADLASVPGAGGLGAVAILYAGISLFGTGPLVAERMIERSGWVASCERGIGASTSPKQPQGPTGSDCQNWLAPFFGSDGAAFCQRHGSEIDALGGLAQRLAQPRRPDTKNTCHCAVRETLDARRTDFAMHAGSLRLITPRAVRHLGDELVGAMTSPACQRRPS